MALTNEQKRILAQTLLGEAGGEGYDGMVAVAHVLNNRARSSRFPNDPVAVALQPRQFSTWNTGEGGNNPGRFGPGSPGYDDAMRAVEAVFVQGASDPTGGATHYWSPSGMKAMGYNETPYWAESETGPGGRVTIGNHVFLAQREPQTAAQAAEQMGGNRVSYGPELGQVPLSALPMPRPDPRPQQAPDPNATHNAFIKRYPFQMDSMPYPVEAAGIRPDPRIAFHPTTFDQRFTAPKPVDRPTRNELEADRLTVVPGRSLGFSPAPVFPSAPARTGMPNADMPRRILSTDKPKTPLSRRNETRAEQQISLPPKRTAQPSQTQTNTRVAPTVQTAGFTRMPDAAFDRISQQMRTESMASDGLGTYPTKMALDDFSPPRPAAPAQAPAPLTRRNEMAAEAQMALPPKQVAPVPAPPIMRGDPLAHITPDGAPLPQPPAMPVMTATAPLQPAPPPTVAQGLLGPLLGALKQPTFTFQNLEVMGRPQPRTPEPERVPGLNKYGRRYNFKTNKFETPGKPDLSKVGFTMKRPTGTIFAAR